MTLCHKCKCQVVDGDNGYIAVTSWDNEETGYCHSCMNKDKDPEVDQMFASLLRAMKNGDFDI